MSEQGGTPHGSGESDAWAIISTLLAGPACWGLIGYGVSELVGGSAWVPIGIVIGFVASFYLVYVKHVRS